MKTSIVLEGYDGGGKSTLAAKLCEELGLEYYRAGSAVHTIEEVEACCETQLKMCEDGGFVLDRVTSISRPCYQTGLDSQELGYLISQMLAVESLAFVVWCRPTNYNHTPRDEEDPTHLQDIVKRRTQILYNYYVLLENSIGAYQFNWYTDSVEDLINEYRRFSSE